MKRLSMLFLMLAVVPLASGQIYKTYDEDGNPVYTDRKPSEDARPMELPEVNVIESAGEIELPPMPELHERERAPEPELSIVSPQPDEHLWGTARTVPVELSSNVELPSDARIVLFLNGEPQAPINSLSTSIHEVPRGEYTLVAEMQTSDGQVLARTDPVTFYMRQTSALHR